MKANVQYGDLEGTVAADMVDGTNSSMQEYLIRKYGSYDGKRYDCRGCDISLGEGFISICYICFDKKEGKYVRIRPEKKVSYEELFAMFKRFHVILGKYMDEIEVDEDFTYIN